MAYPASNPVSKHDLLCPSSILDAVNGSGDGDPLATVDALSSAVVQSAVPLSGIPRDVVKLATVYTYPDAPTKPKPLSRAPRVWRLVERGAFDAATDGIANSANGGTNGGGVMKRCAVAVKLPSRIPPGDDRSQRNSKMFRSFVRFLHDRNLAAMLACDSAGRICFLVPSADENDGGWDNDGSGGEKSEGWNHSARLYYAPMKGFLPWAKENHAKHEAKHAAKNGAGSHADEDEPETWTPQYTPPPEEECGPRGWDDASEGEPETWTPQYDPPPEEECGPRGWDNGNSNGSGWSDEPVLKMDEDDGPVLKMEEDDGPVLKMEEDGGDTGLFVPPGADNGGGFGNGEGDGAGLFVPPSSGDNGGWGTSDAWGNTGGGNGEGNDGAGLFVPPSSGDNGGWDASDAWGNTGNGFGNNQNLDSTTTDTDTGLGAWTAAPPESTDQMEGGVFHANKGAAEADAFYSGLTRTLDTRADSVLYHMRSFNGWVKATQIAELDPDTSRAPGAKKRSRNAPMRVLDLACGKGGDLGKWTLHPRRLENYVGVDVARGSLIDAAKRARDMGRRGMKRCTFTLADLGEDVPGRRRSRQAKRMQRLLTWNLQSETSEDKRRDPVFVAAEGGGISESDKFDVVSIQFAIHYMMSTLQRARRFFRTVSSLLEVGGNLVATTIDARVVAEELLDSGLDLHFDDADLHEEVDRPEEEARHGNGNRKRKARDDREDGSPAATVAVGGGVCRLKFDAAVVKRVFRPAGTPFDMFGLEYTFTLVEGSDHAAGVGEAVDLPEWLTPVPALEALAEESGLRLEYATNFHEFYEERKSPSKHPLAHNALYSMKVLNRDGSISGQEWEVSRMYVALKFRKVREASTDPGDDRVTEEEMRE